MSDGNEPDFGSLDEEAWKRQEAEDEQALARFINPDVTGAGGAGGAGGIGADLDSFMKGASIDQRGKADDAIDFEDIDLSDDELPDEEPAGAAAAAAAATAAADDDDDDEDEGAPADDSAGDVPGLMDDVGTSHETDDLFGDLPASSPLGTHADLPSSPDRMDVEEDEEDARDGAHPPAPPSAAAAAAADTIEKLRALNFDHDVEPSRDGINQDPDIPAPPESEEVLVQLQWPGFEKGIILNWNELLRPKQATWIAKRPPKPPKPLVPTKLSLELDADQEKLFRIPGAAAAPVSQKIKDAEARGLVCCEEPESVEPADLDIFDVDGDADSDEADTAVVGGFTLRDIATLCDDWEALIEAAPDATTTTTTTTTTGASAQTKKPAQDRSDDEAFWDELLLEQQEAATRKRKREPPRGLPEVPRFVAPSFDRFAEATAKLARRVVLDRNDPYLLIDDVAESERASKRRRVPRKLVRMANGRLAPDLGERFNFSNDLAYEALKENHSNKVRATTAYIPVEHSLPAQRLQWPYYKVKLAASDPYSYHRPQLQTRQAALAPVRFARPAVHRRKLLRGRRVRDVYRTSRDVSMNDNSTAVLLEYCEEIPTVLSNFGMGSKIINYYRRSKGSEGRPEKRDLGEACILQPEDRSPFALFGQVRPGEVVPTLYNHMYRAPVFKHAPRPTDFLVGRTTTGAGGSAWYLRAIDHLYVVGQTLPSLEVPGPHSRKVTNIAKNRLKMVSYRLLRKSDHVTLHDITRHVADSNESQNRQKLKEFLRFRKETKDWALPEDEEMMDEAGIRALVKPEDVCLLDAMQVGQHELENGGYHEAAAAAQKEDGDDWDLNLEDAPPDALANKMAPWKTTRAFIDASYGKAMIAVHGPGDPTGRGLGISFLRTSMKGGFLEQLQGPLATSADAIERQRKANGGHLYNVKNQDQLYTEAITDIWNRQRESLQDAQEHDDDDVQPQEDEDERFNVQPGAAAAAHAEGMSQVSRSAASAANKRKLQITREVRRPDGRKETVTEVVYDPVVIAQYVKKRRQLDIEQIDIYNAQLTGDAEKDRLLLEMAEKEKERLEKNKERRHKREKQKKMMQKRGGGGGAGSASTPVDDGGEGSPEPTTEKATGTTRKCANCGQVGHIKTNKKSGDTTSPTATTASTTTATSPTATSTTATTATTTTATTRFPFHDPSSWKPEHFQGRGSFSIGRG